LIENPNGKNRRAYTRRSPKLAFAAARKKTERGRRLGRPRS
jgi:hypothetical protein